MPAQAGKPENKGNINIAPGELLDNEGIPDFMGGNGVFIRPMMCRTLAPGGGLVLYPFLIQCLMFMGERAQSQTPSLPQGNHPGIPVRRAGGLVPGFSGNAPVAAATGTFMAPLGPSHALSQTDYR